MNETDQTLALPWRAGVVMDFTRSELFDRIFDEGMELVEETAAYLDGAGRQESRRLSRTGAPDDAADAGGQLAPGPARRQGRADDSPGRL